MIFMPILYRLFCLYSFNMLSFTFCPLNVLETLKKNHCEYPFVLMSFWSSKLYYESDNLETKDKLPHSNLDSNTKVLSYFDLGW